MRLALSLGHPVYDCMYLALATEHGRAVLPLADIGNVWEPLDFAARDPQRKPGREQMKPIDAARSVTR